MAFCNDSIGFLTIATGDTHYYAMARNLLRSYRYFSVAPLPFAILCDNKNEYTAEFDDVQLFKEPKCGYLDKLEMFDYLPYDVNIFIDADCLAYDDLNRLFEYFKEADDFSCFGRVLPLDDKTGWFEYENLGDLREKVEYTVGLHGGIYYMRKTDICRKVLDNAKAFVADYASYHFKGKFSSPGDEPLIALSMAVNRCRPIPHDLGAIDCYWEHEHHMKFSMKQGKALDCDNGICTSLVHWGTRFTKTPIYRKQIAVLESLDNGGNCVALWYINCKYGIIALVERVLQFRKRAVNWVRRIFVRKRLNY